MELTSAQVATIEPMPRAEQPVDGAQVGVAFESLTDNEYDAGGGSFSPAANA